MTLHKNESNPVTKENTTNSPGGRPLGAMSNAGWNAFSTLWSIAVSFLIAPALIHNLGTDQYGILLLVWSVTGILGLVGFGFGEATLRYVAHYYGEGNISGVNRIMGATLSFYLVICLIVCLGLFTAAPMVVRLFSIPESEHQLVSWLLRLSAVVFSLNAVSLTYGSIPMALHRYDISSKIGVIQSVVRSGGYILLAVNKFGILHLVLWDVVTQLGTLITQAIVVRRISPGVKLMPSLSFGGLREIVGFSVFSFLTFAFHKVQREAGKMILAAQLGPSPVAYLGTPDNVAQRLHMVVASGSETLMPRFSANRDSKAAQSLFLNGTWSSLVISLVLLLPLVLLMPDFLRLWISPEFARDSAALGQLVALSYIFQGAYAPTATFFRGTGRPSLVTVVIFFAGLVTLLGSLLLIPKYGAIGVGFAYLLGSIPAFFGLVHGWFHMFGRSSLTGLIRVVGLPLLMSSIAYASQYWIRGSFGSLTWPGLFILGALCVVLTGALIFGADWAVGGSDAPSRQFIAKLGKSPKLVFLSKFLPLKQAR